MTQLAALSVTPAVRAWLRGARHARLLHVFDHALNLIAGEAVLSLVTPRIGDGPFNAVIPSDGFLAQVAATAAVHVAPDALRIGDLSIDFSAAKVWNPHPDWRASQARVGRVSACAPLLREVLAQSAPASSFAALVVDLPAPESRLEAQVLAVARQHAHDLHQHALGLNPAQCAVSATRLAGLGAGLTPAGDDWLLGCALAAHCGFPSPDAAALLLRAVQQAAPGTHPLAANWLRAAVEGACSRFWHTLLAGCLREDASAVQRAAQEIVRQGHSSGADALAGFLAQMIW